MMMHTILITAHIWYMEIPKQFWGKVYFNHQDDVDDNKVIKKNHQFNHVLKLEMYKRQSALES